MRFIILVISLLGGIEVLGQVSYLQPNQVPLLLNPSLAGSKVKSRVSGAWQNQSTVSEKSNRFYASYDKVVNKLGSGVGVWINHEGEREGLLEMPLRETVANPTDFQYQNYTSEVGFVIAPKYNIPYKNNYSEIFLSVSPGLFVSYERGKREKNSPFEEVFNYVYNETYPGGKAVLTDTLSYTHSTLNSNRIKAGLSLMANSKSLIFLYKVYYQVNFANELLEYRLDEKGVGTVRTENAEVVKSFSTIAHTLFAGKTFPKNSETLVSVTALAGLGMHHALNYDKSEFQNYSKGLINYLHSSLTFRVSRLLLGGGFNQSNQRNHKFASLGYQGKKLKIMGNLGTSTFKSGGKWVSEISLNYFF